MEENKHAAAAASVDQRLGTAPLVPLIFSLALPTALAQLVNMLYNIVDRIYVGHIPGSGSLALAGLGVTYPIIVLITAFSNLIGMGGAPRASVAMGRGDYKTAEKILGNCITLLIVLSVVLSVVFTIYGEPYRLEKIDYLYTNPVKMSGVRSEIHGEAKIEQIRGIRTSVGSVRYSADVVRYVEIRKTLPVTGMNVPADKYMMVYPPYADVRFRCAFPYKGDPEDNVSVHIDYDDFLKSRTGKCVAVTDALPEGVISCSVEPQIFECVVNDR